MWLISRASCARPQQHVLSGSVRLVSIAESSWRVGLAIEAAPCVVWRADAHRPSIAAGSGSWPTRRLAGSWRRTSRIGRGPSQREASSHRSTPSCSVVATSSRSARASSSSPDLRAKTRCPPSAAPARQRSTSRLKRSRSPDPSACCSQLLADLRYSSTPTLRAIRDWSPTPRSPASHQCPGLLHSSDVWVEPIPGRSGVLFSAPRQSMHEAR